MRVKIVVGVMIFIVMIFVPIKKQNSLQIISLHLKIWLKITNVNILKTIYGLADNVGQTFDGDVLTQTRDFSHE